MRIKTLSGNLLLLIFLICLGLSCKTTEVTKSIERKEVRIKDVERADQAKREEIQEIWVKKIQGKFEWNNKEQSFKANFKIKRDSIIEISLMNQLGIEALRVVCTTDSFGFIDRINRNYFSGDYTKLSRKVGYKTDLFFIQAVLLNEIATLDQNTRTKLFKEQKKLIVSNNRCSASITSLGIDENNQEKEIHYFLEFEAENLSVVHGVISDFSGKNKIELHYGEHEKMDNILYPGNIIMAIESKGISLGCNLKMEKVLINTDFGINYIVNQKYKRIDW